MRENGARVRGKAHGATDHTSRHRGHTRSKYRYKIFIKAQIIVKAWM